MTHIAIQQPTRMEVTPKLVSVTTFPVIGTFSVRLDGAFISVMTPEGHISRMEDIAVDLILSANELRTLADTGYATLMRHTPDVFPDEPRGAA